MQDNLFNYLHNDRLDSYRSKVLKIYGFVAIFNEKHESALLKMLREVDSAIKEIMNEV